MMYDIVRCFVLFAIIIGNCNTIIVNMFVLFVIASISYIILSVVEKIIKIQYANN